MTREIKQELAPRKLSVLDLFSGIGGFSLGLEQAGMTTVALCEIDPYCRAVLRKHWPGVPIYEDIKALSAGVLERDGITVDVICGGFPCQDLSFAGKRAGIEGSRSGLWGEYRRLISEIRPRFVIVENVPGLLSLGMDTVLGGLAALGYDCLWDCIPAAAVGAPHLRDRVWIIAYANSGQRDRPEFEVRPGRDAAGAVRKDVADTASTERARQRAVKGGKQGGFANGGRGHVVGGLGRVADGVSAWVDASGWLQEPENIPRVSKGQENRANRLMALGNALVPQVAHMIGMAIMMSDGGV